MITAASALSQRSDRMSPPALALAVLLHASVILALWWMSVHRPPPPGEESVEITFEIPKTAEPPPQPSPPLPKQAPAMQAAPMPLGLPPPAPLISNRPTQVPPAPLQPKELPPTPQLPSSREATAAAAATPAPVQPAPVPAPPLPDMTAPPQAAPVLPRPDLRPSPLAPTPRPTRPPAAAAAAAEEPSPHPFVNPADAFARARLADNYLWQITRKIVGYQYQANTSVRQGTSVVRIVIARDGRLLGAEIIRSSGVPEFDRGVLAGVRAGAPYTPLPPEIKGESASFDLPLVSISR